MKKNKITYPLLCAASSFALLIAGGSFSPAQAQSFVPTNMQIALRTAASQGDQAFLAQLNQLSAQYPNLATSLQQHAISLRPDLATAINASATAPAAGGAGVGTAAGAAGGATVASPVLTAPVVAAPAAAGVGAAGIATGVAVGGAAIGGAALAFSGGSSSSDDSTGGGTTIDPWLTFGALDSDYTAAPSTFEDVEYQNVYHLGTIKASSGLARDVTGSGIRIGIVDSGIDTDHPEFAGRIDLTDSINLIGAMADPSNIDDHINDGHGTHVAGVIAANNNGSGIQGIAYDAELVIYKTFHDDGITEYTATNAEFADAYTRAVTDNLDIVNGSFTTALTTPPYTGTVDETLADAIQAASDAGVITVFSTGNDGISNPQTPALLPYVEAANSGSGLYVYGGSNDYSSIDTLIAVTSVDSAGTISSFANRCGVAADWCISAPGGAIVSTYSNGGYATMSGTSQAAPMVTGAVALMIERFPSLTPEQIVERIFAAANKSGIYADSSVYGQGLLDIEKATRPFGSISVTSASTIEGVTFSTASTSLGLGSSMGSSAVDALRAVRIAGFDNMGATFYVDATTLISSAEDYLDNDKLLAGFGKDRTITEIALKDDLTLQFNIGSSEAAFYETKTSPDGNGEKKTELSTFKLAHQLSDSESFTVGYNIDFAKETSALRSEFTDRNLISSKSAFANPWLASYDENYMSSFSVQLNDSVSIKSSNIFAQNITDLSEEGSAISSTLDLGFQASSDFALSFSGGIIHEENSLLGSETSGGFGIQNGADTYFVGAQATYNLADKIDLVGSYYQGVTNVDANETSLIQDMSNLTSRSFSLGVVGETDDPYNTTKWGFIGNAPLTVTSGSADFKLATSRDRTGKIYYDTHNVSLAPSDQELNLEAFLSHELSEKEFISGSVLQRFNPSSNSELQDETIFMMKYSKKF